MKITLEMGEVDITPEATGIAVTPSHFNMNLKPYEVPVIVAAIESVLAQWKAQTRMGPNPK